MPEPVRHRAGSRHVEQHLPHRHERHPPHGGRDVRAALAVGEPLRALEREVAGEEGDGVGGVLEVDDAGGPPSRGGGHGALLLVREAHRPSPFVDRQGCRGAGIAVGREPRVQVVEERRSHHQRPVDRLVDDVDGRQDALDAHRAEREAVQVEPGPLGLGQRGPVLANGLEHRPRGVDDGLLVGEQGDPAGQVGVLHPGDRGVAVPEVLQGVGAVAVEEPHPGGRGDDEHLAVEGPSALELGEDEVGPALHGVGALEAGVDADRRPGPRAVDRLQACDRGAAAHEAAPVVAEVLPPGQRLGRAGALGSGRPVGALRTGRVTRGEDGVGPREEPVDDDAGPHPPEQHGHQRRAEDDGQPARKAAAEPVDGGAGQEAHAPAGQQQQRRHGDRDGEDDGPDQG